MKGFKLGSNKGNVDGNIGDSDNGPILDGIILVGSDEGVTAGGTKR